MAIKVSLFLNAGTCRKPSVEGMLDFLNLGHIVRFLDKASARILSGENHLQVRWFPLQIIYKQIFIENSSADGIHQFVKKKDVVIVLLGFPDNPLKLLLLIAFPIGFFLIGHLKAELFAGKAVHKSNIRRKFQKLSFTGGIILHKLINRYPETIACSPGAQPHTGGCFSLSAAAVNVNISCLSIQKNPSLADSLLQKNNHCYYNIAQPMAAIK